MKELMDRMCQLMNGLVIIVTETIQEKTQNSNMECNVLAKYSQDVKTFILS